MTLSPEERALQQVIQDARRTKSKIAGCDETRGVELAGAYRIQAAADGERVLKGYKFGLVSRAKQEQMGLKTPLFGRIYADMLQNYTVSLSAYVQPRLEPEVVLVLRGDIAASATGEGTARAVGGYFLGVDILDSVWEGYRFTAAEVAADNTSGGGFLLGSRRYGQMVGGRLRLYGNGKLLTEGQTGDLGDPVKGLQWLAQQVGGLKAGQIIFLGSPAASVPAFTGTLELVESGGGCLVASIKE